MAKGCTLCGAIYHTKTFCYKNRTATAVVTKPKPCEWCGYTSHPSFACGKNPKRASKKTPPQHCTHCDEFGHIRGTCPTRLHLKQRSMIDEKTGRYPDLSINRIGKYNKKWQYTRARWILANPPNHAGYYKCHYCPTMLTRNEMTLDHKESRSRHPELRFVLSNLVPCCFDCNGRKGSRSHDEYTHECQ